MTVVMKNRRNNVLPFPKPPEEPGTSTIIYQIGGERFALHMQFEDLPLAPPPVVMAKRRVKKAPSKIVKIVPGEIGDDGGAWCPPFPAQNQQSPSSAFRLASAQRGSDECHHAATAAKRKTDQMTTSKKKNKNATAAPTTKARVAKRSAKTAPRKAEPDTKAASATKPPTAAHGGSKTEKILDLLKRPGGVTLKELAKATGWKPTRCVAC
jgi:hypothetical protein